MLLLDDEVPFSGVTTYLDDDPAQRSENAFIHIKVVVEGEVPTPLVARVDTAAPYVILNSELNRQIGLNMTSDQIPLHTAAGRKEGSLERVPITLIAEGGESLEVDATLFVCDDWDRGSFLGYGGLLERIRVAVDPSSRKYYFGRS